MIVQAGLWPERLGKEFTLLTFPEMSASCYDGEKGGGKNEEGEGKGRERKCYESETKQGG